ANRKPLTAAELNLMDKILDRIGREGPLMVKDFDNDRQEASSGWWDWRPAKLALERLYLDGRLMVTRGKDFHKVYDLPRNLVPDDVDMSMPTPEEFAPAYHPAGAQGAGNCLRQGAGVAGKVCKGACHQAGDRKDGGGRRGLYGDCRRC